ncbi:MAG: 2-dehydropantoate 2-reductase [Acidobacteria bacterium]|nr:2-dehydropantoate 2-reductase [Acidobacteriota bacterium]
MKFAVMGAGAIGAFFGALMAKAGEDVSLIARGPHLRAMQQHGIRVRGSLGEFAVFPPATDDPASIGAVDVVLLTVKAHSLTDVAPKLGPLTGPDTAVVCMQNGIPWWYFFRHGGPWEGTRLETVDPGGTISTHIDIDRVIGCVMYCSTIISEPGVIEYLENTRLSIGELDGGHSPRCEALAAVFKNAGIKCSVRSDIRQDLWVKLMGNVAFNPISALTGATLEEMTECNEIRTLAGHIMSEAGDVAAALGIKPGITIEQRIAAAARVGPHKTSMLQDLEAGRPLELDPLVGAVVELGERLSIPVPHTSTLYACTKLLGARRSEESHPR